VIIDHASRLHEGVQDGAAAKLEPAPHHVPAHRVRDRAGGRYLRHALPGILNGSPAGETPQIRIQRTKFLLDLKHAVGVVDDGIDFCPVAHNASVGEQLLHFLNAIAGNHIDLKIVKSLPEVFPFTQDGVPAQTSLHPIQRQEFKQPLIIVERHAPLFIMIAGEQDIVEVPNTAGEGWIDGLVHELILSDG